MAKTKEVARRSRKKPAAEPLMWHFLPEDRRLANDDGRLVRVGRMVKVKCQPVLCEVGLHACKRPIDALTYAPGPIICRVTLGGEVIHGEDKSVSTERTVLWMADATDTLHRFACAVVEEALKTASVEDQRCYEALRIKLLWLEGKATDEQLDAARAAAWDTARAAAWAAVRAAAWDTARAAAWDGASAAVRAAAWDTAWDTAWAAAWAAQNRRLESMLLSLGPKKHANA